MTCSPCNIRSTAHRTFGRTVRTAALLAAMTLIAGCSMFRSAENENDGNEVASVHAATTQQTYSSSMQVPQSLQPAHRPVVQEQLPLIYLVESNGTCRVTNTDTGEEIAVFPVQQSQIVRVESKGVLLANKQVLGAQLAPGTYAIEIIAEGSVPSGQIRATQTVTRALPPTTKPATQPTGAPKSVPAPAREPIVTPPANPASPATDLPPPQ